MINYEKMYLRLFNRITDALKELDKCNYGKAAEILRSGQKETEEMYMDSETDMPPRNDGKTA